MDRLESVVIAKDGGKELDTNEPRRNVSPQRLPRR